MRERPRDAVFWAGSAWLTVAIVGGIISAVFFVFYALIALPFLVFVPLCLVSGLWGGGAPSSRGSRRPTALRPPSAWRRSLSVPPTPERLWLV